ncbi:uncharacterized protein LOC134697607 [Mytilus trossulus]|uniref:uncharacterized protein LOC134697607 n=1 Tax=Mytilus trossulus TaxID=6551 RepID=UPI003007D7BD
MTSSTWKRRGEGGGGGEEKISLSTSKTIIMTPILTGILFVSMCLASTAAFSLSLQSGIIPVTQGTNVKYDKDINAPALGDGYDRATGVFTVPTTGAGTYLISVSMMSGFKSAHLNVMKGTTVLGWLFTDKTYNMASLTIDALLAANDQMSVQMKFGSELFDVYNTFSVTKI